MNPWMRATILPLLYLPWHLTPLLLLTPLPPPPLLPPLTSRMLMQQRWVPQLLLVTAQVAVAPALSAGWQRSPAG
jgi:hypothetical protein